MGENKGKLELRNLSVATVDGKEILSDISMEFLAGGRYSLLGANGSGKTSLVSCIMGHPGYKITSGEILLDGENINDLPTNERARRGIFLASQYPVEIAGVSYASFLRTALLSTRRERVNFQKVLDNLKEEATALGFRDFDYMRDANVGFSGGEKKKSEILQMLMLRPRFAFLDEPDSGLDKKSVGLLAKRLTQLDFPVCLVVISHHDKLLSAINPTKSYTLGEK